MTIKTTILDTNKPHLVSIELSLYDILHDHISGEMREMLIQSLSCADEVIGHVCEQLIDGYTYDGFQASWSFDSNTAIQLAKNKIAKNSDHAIKKTIELLENKIAFLEQALKDEIAKGRVNDERHN
jgi:hypothetical protein